mgnify:FL=1
MFCLFVRPRNIGTTLAVNTARKDAIILMAFVVGESPVSAVLSLLRSRLLRPVFIALGIALLVQVLVAVALTRSTVTALEADLATRLGVDSQHLSGELEQASRDVTSSLDSLSQNTRQRLSTGLSARLKD